MRTFRLGKNALTNHPLRLSLEVFTKTHTRVQGTTGAGKSKFLQLLAETIIQSNHTLILIDGKGDLHDTMVKSCAARGVGADRVLILDPKDSMDNAPGFNPIALNDLEPYARAGIVLEGLKKIFQEEEERKTWLEDYIIHSVVPLSLAKLGILELEPFLINDDFREAVISAAGDRRIKEWWEHHDNEPPTQRSLKIGAAKSRASLLWSSGESLRRTLGQVKDSIDWKRILNRKGVVLVNANESAGIRIEAAWTFGTLVLQRVIEEATKRPKGRRPPVFVIIDECQEFASGDLIRALTKLRGFGVHLVLAHQTLADLRKVEGLESAVASCCQNQLIFSISHEDAEIQVHQLFTGYLPERRIVHELKTIAFEPKQRWEKVQSTTETETEHPETTTRHEHPETESIHREANGFILHGDERGRTLAPESVSYTHTSGGITRGTSTQTTPVFITEYKPFEQVTSRQVESLEDLWERCKAWIMNQSPRRAQLKLGELSPIPVFIADVKEPSVSDRLLQAWKRLVYKRYPKAEALDEELEKRHTLYLEANQPKHEWTGADTIEGEENPPISAGRQTFSPRAPRRSSVTTKRREDS